MQQYQFEESLLATGIRMRADLLGAGRVAYFKHRGAPRGPWDIQLLKDGWTNANMVIAADINGNGRLDIAAAERGGNELRWWRNEGP